MFEWLKATGSKPPKQPTILDDPDFGRLIYNHDESWWTGTIAVADEPIELTVHAGLDGPAPHQRRIWTRLKNDLLDMSKRVIREYLSKVQTPHNASPVLPEEFSLEGIQLYPEKWIDSLDVVLDFSLLKDEGAIWRFEMKDGEVVGSGRDN
jgi:hypothetical protein